MAERQTGRRIVEGRVVKATNAKTRVVAIEQLIPHHLYGRFTKRTVKCVTHDEKEESHVGDRVRIQECRPLSRTKRWRLVQIVDQHEAK